MAKESEFAGVWQYNRHDRRRGTAPPTFICHNPDCGANLHEVGVWVLEGTLRRLAGNYVVGETDGGVVLEVMQYDDFSADVCCGECDSPQIQLHLEDIIFSPEAVPFE